MHSTRYQNNTDLVYWHLHCIESGGVHLPLVSICALVYIYIDLAFHYI